MIYKGHNRVHLYQGDHKPLALYKAVRSENLWNEKWGNYYYDEGNNGNKNNNTGAVGSQDHILLKPDTTYTISYNVSYYGSLYVLFFNESGLISYTRNLTFTTPSNCEYMLFYTYKNGTHTYQNDIMLVEGDQPKPYQPYLIDKKIAGYSTIITTPRTFQHTYNSSAKVNVEGNSQQELNGATSDVVINGDIVSGSTRVENGALKYGSYKGLQLGQYDTYNTATKTLTKGGNETDFSLSNNYLYDNNGRRWILRLNTEMPITSTSSNVVYTIPNVNVRPTYQTDKSIYLYQDSNITYFQIADDTNLPSTKTSDEVKAYLQNYRLYYQLATPITYTLPTPEYPIPIEVVNGVEIVSDKGYNQLLGTNESNVSVNGITITNNRDGSWTINGTATGGRASKILYNAKANRTSHKYFVKMISPITLMIVFIFLVNTSGLKID